MPNPSVLSRCLGDIFLLAVASQVLVPEMPHEDYVAMLHDYDLAVADFLKLNEPTTPENEAEKQKCQERLNDREQLGLPLSFPEYPMPPFSPSKTEIEFGGKTDTGEVESKVPPLMIATAKSVPAPKKVDATPKAKSAAKAACKAKAAAKAACKAKAAAKAACKSKAAAKAACKAKTAAKAACKAKAAAKAACKSNAAAKAACKSNAAATPPDGNTDEKIMAKRLHSATGLQPKLILLVGNYNFKDFRHGKEYILSAVAVSKSPAQHVAFLQLYFR